MGNEKTYAKVPSSLDEIKEPGYYYLDGNSQNEIQLISDPELTKKANEYNFRRYHNGK